MSKNDANHAGILAALSAEREAGRAQVREEAEIMLTKLTVDLYRLSDEWRGHPGHSLAVYAHDEVCKLRSALRGEQTVELNSRFKWAERPRPPACSDEGSVQPKILMEPDWIFGSVLIWRGR